MAAPGTPQSQKAGKGGDGTRNALIRAGLDLFGEYGLNGTTTRMLSKTSGANISAIPYYFGNKDGLYHAVLEHISQRLGETFGAQQDAIRAALATGNLSPRRARALFVDLLLAAARMFVESNEPQTWARIIVREQVSPSRSFEVLYERRFKPMQQIMAALIAACLGLDPADDEVKIRGHALLGQVLVFTVSRESLLRHLGTETLGPPQTELIRTILAAHTEACLGVSLGDGGS